jgi:hypothetical protein
MALKSEKRPQLGGWAPGGYYQKCFKCKEEFNGDKRATICADFAYALPNTEPTDAEINEGIAKFCGWRPSRSRFGCGSYFQCWLDPSGIYHINPPSYATSFDLLREAMGKMTSLQKSELLIKIYDPFHGRGPAWLLFHITTKALSEAVYKIMKGEK